MSKVTCMIQLLFLAIVAVSVKDVTCWDPYSDESLLFGCHIKKESKIALNLNSFEPKLEIKVECKEGIEFTTFMCLQFCYDPVNENSPRLLPGKVLRNKDLFEQKTFNTTTQKQRRIKVTYGCRCVLENK
ncbi:uncharacterized protein LOC120329234 [Styela clava]